MQKIINIIVGVLIKFLAFVAGNDPLEWLVDKSLGAEIDQEHFNKLADLL